MPVTDDRAGLKNRRRETNLHQRDGGGSHRNGGGGVHGNAKRAMVGGSFSLMEVRYLNRREYGQKDKTQYSHDRQSTGPCATILTDFGLESCQSTDPSLKDTQNWTRQGWRWLRLIPCFSGRTGRQLPPS
jgi:hypothetical protein